MRDPQLRRRSDGGFTLIELLVVMVIIGVLAAIAVPVFLSQRAKAHDTSTKADIATMGKEIATYFVDGQGTLTLDYATTPGKVVISDGVWTSTVSLTNGTAEPTSGSQANLGDERAWCISLTDPRGRAKEFRYSAATGLEPGTCAP